MPEISEVIIKKILAKVYVHSLKQVEYEAILDNRSRTLNVSKSGALPQDVYEDYLSQLKQQGLIATSGKFPVALTPKGRTRIVVVMVGGAFDIIHPGHVETLRQAKALGDVLAVSVARNSTFVKNKHKEPIHDEKVRMELVSAIRFVDLAVLGSQNDIFETVQFLKPDIIALGYDQSHNENAIKEGAKKMGIEARVVRLASTSPEIKTSSIISSRNKTELLSGT
jgi:cytidyltransferase-like protein